MNFWRVTFPALCFNLALLTLLFGAHYLLQWSEY